MDIVNVGTPGYQTCMLSSISGCPFAVPAQSFINMNSYNAHDWRGCEQEKRTAGLRGTADGFSMRTQVKRKWEEMVYIDFHNDTSLKLFYDSLDFTIGDQRLQVDRPKIELSTAPLALFFAVCCDTVFRGELLFQRTAAIIKALKQALGDEDSNVRIALKGDDLRDIFEHDKSAAFLAIEGGHVLNDSVEHIRDIHELGVRLLTLTHWQSTSWASSAHATTDNGLSELGKRVVIKLNDVGIIVDIAHASWKTVKDTAKISRYPIVCSHGSARGVYSHDRALPDDAIRAIASTGGVIGISFFPEALVFNPHVNREAFRILFDKVGKVETDPSLNDDDKVKMIHKLLTYEYEKPVVIPDMTAVARHIIYIAELVGIDHVAIGSDFDGVPYTCAGLEDISALPHLEDELKSHFSSDEIRRIMGGNIHRVIRDHK